MAIDDWKLQQQRDYWSGKLKPPPTEEERRKKAQAAVTAGGRSCKVEGCDRPIAKNNSTGVCSRCQNGPMNREIKRLRLVRKSEEGE